MGRSDRSVRRPGSPSTFLARGGGRGGGGGGRGGAPHAGRPRSDEDAEPACSIARASTRSSRRPGGRSTGRSSRSCPCSTGVRRCSSPPTTEQSIRDAVAWAEKQNVRIVLQTGADAQRVAGFLKQHDVPVILSSVLSLPPREDEFHAYPYQTPGRAREGGRDVRVFERRLPVLARRAVPGRPRRGLGPRHRRRDQGADAGCGARPRRRQPGRQHRGRQGREPRRPHAAIPWRFDRRSST